MPFKPQEKDVHTPRFMRNMQELDKQPVDGDNSSMQVLWVLTLYHRALSKAMMICESLAARHLRPARQLGPDGQPGNDNYHTRYWILALGKPTEEIKP